VKKLNFLFEYLKIPTKHLFKEDLKNEEKK